MWESVTSGRKPPQTPTLASIPRGSWRRRRRRPALADGDAEVRITYGGDDEGSGTEINPLISLLSRYLGSFFPDQGLRINLDQIDLV